MTIGEKIINEIVWQRMFRVSHPDPDAAHVFVWSSGADEQLEAVLSEHIQAEKEILTNDILLSQGAYAMCDTNLKNALCEIEDLRKRLKDRG